MNIFSDIKAEELKTDTFYLHSIYKLNDGTGALCYNTAASSQEYRGGLRAQSRRAPVLKVTGEVSLTESL